MSKSLKPVRFIFFPCDEANKGLIYQHVAINIQMNIQKTPSSRCLGDKSIYNGRKDAMTRRSYRMKTSDGSSRPFLVPTIYSPLSSKLHHSLPNYTKASEGIRKIWTSNSGVRRRSRSRHGGVS